MRLDVRPVLSGARGYIGSVVVAVLLAPVLPDVAVDLFGGGPGWGDGLLRAGALTLVFVLCATLYLGRLAVARHRVRRRGVTLGGIERCDVLIVPIGLSSTYQARSRRTGDTSILEWVVDAAGPARVIGVVTPEVRETVGALTRELAVDDITFEYLEIRDAGDPALALADADRMIAGLTATDSPLLGRRVAVDITGGTVPMSMAMLRLAAQLGVSCTYVASRRANGRILPGSQRGRAFDPTAMIAAAPSAVLTTADDSVAPIDGLPTPDTEAPDSAAATDPKPTT